jgi:sugar lactone lactonase YvrE
MTGNVARIRLCLATRRELWGFALLLLLALAGGRTGLAQTVTFIGAQTTIVPAGGLQGPTAVAVDLAGNIYIADSTNGVVTEVPANGGAQTNVVTGLNTPYGVAVDAAGDIFVADAGTNQVVEVPAGGGAQTTIGTGLNFPSDVAVDAAGDVFIADTNNNRVVEVAAAGGAQTTVAMGLNRPLGVAVDNAGDVFIADTQNNQVVEVPAVGMQTTVGTGLSFPDNVAVDAAGDVFITNNGTGQVIEVSNQGVQSVLPTTGLTDIWGVAVDGTGDLFITDVLAGELVEFQTNSVDFGRINVCPSGQTIPAPCSQTVTLNYKVTANSNLLTPVVTTTGAANLDFTLGTGSTCSGTVTGATCTVSVVFTSQVSGTRTGSATVTIAGECEFLPCNLPHATTLLSGTGVAPQAALLPGVFSQIQPTGIGPLIWGVAVDASGNLYYSDTENGTVSKITNGASTALAFTGLIEPTELAVDGTGSVYVINGESTVIKLDQQGNQTTVVTGEAVGVPAITSLALDDRGTIYVGGTDGNGTGRVFRIDAAAIAHQVGGAFGLVYGLAVGSDGTVYIADYTGTANSNAYAVDPFGNQRTIGAGIVDPLGIAVDPGGTVYVVDVSTDSLVVIDSAGIQKSYPASTLLGPLAGFVGYQMAIDGVGSLYFGGTEVVNSAETGTVAIINRQSASLNFGTVQVGTQATPVPETIANIGNQPLTISATPIYTGTFFESPQANSIPAECGTTVAAGATCLVTSTFTPSGAGLITGSFTLTDNALNNAASTQVAQLEGAGTGQDTPVAMMLTGPTLPNGEFGGVYVFTVTETDAADNPVQGDSNVVRLSLSGPQEYVVEVTLTNGVGTATFNLDEGNPADILSAVDESLPALTATNTFQVNQNPGPGENFATITLSASPAAPYSTDNVLVSVAVNGGSPPGPTGTVSYSIDNGATQTATLFEYVSPTTGDASPTSTVALALGRLPAGNHFVSVTYNPSNGFNILSGPQIVTFTVTDPPLSLVSSDHLATFANAGTLDGVAVDTNGNVYLADAVGARVLEYSTAGVQTVLPITGLVQPNGLAFDRNGNLYISDKGNDSVIEFLANGNGQLTLPFTGLGAPGKVAVDQNNNVYVADPTNNQVLLLNSDSIQNTVAAQGLNAPQGVAVDDTGNLYIADTGNGRVIEFTPQQVQTTIFTGISPDAVDASGNIYVADSSTQTVTRIDMQGHQTHLNTTLASPSDVAVDALGNVYAPAPQAAGTVLEMSTAPGGRMPDTPVGAATPTTANVNYQFPSSLATAPNAAANELSGGAEFFTSGSSMNCANGIAAGGVCGYPISFNPTLPGMRSGSIALSNTNGTLLTSVVYGKGLAPLATYQPYTDTGISSPGLVQPGNLTVDAGGNVYVTDLGNTATSKVFKITPGGVQTGSAIQVQTPGGIAVDGIGNLFVSDVSTGQIIELIAPGAQVQDSGYSDFSNPVALAIDGAGYLYVAEQGGGDGGSVEKVSTAGDGFREFISPDIFIAPTAIAVDSSGNVFIADSTSGNVMKIPPFGLTSAYATNVTGSAMAVDAAGNLYVGNATTGQITEISSAGNQNVIATIPTLSGLAIGGNGTLYYSRTSDASVHSLTQQSAPPLNFGSVTVGAQSASQIITLSNIGNQPLTVSALNVPAPFELTPAPQGLTSCSAATSLAAGTFCSIPFAFAPTAAGPATVQAAVTDNSLNAANSMQGITLQGQGSAIPPVIESFTPNYTYYSNGPTVVAVLGNAFVSGATVTVNGASLAATFVSATQLNISITPSNYGGPGTLNIVVINPDGTLSNAEPFTVLPSPILLTPVMIAFGNQAVGTSSASQTVTVTNTTDAAYNLTSLIIDSPLDPADFPETNNCPATLEAGASCQVNITFTPGGVGARSSGFAAYNNSPVPQSFIPLTGTGTGGILQVNPGNLKTIAGTGISGYTGDGGAAIAAELNIPDGMAFDSLGNLYIADTLNSVIRKVDTAGNITTAAGNGTPGFSGDGGPATSAELTIPYSVALDAAGNLYIQDTGNARIRKVDATGTITTIAGNGTAGYGGDGGPAANAQLSGNQGARFDKFGNLYFADCGNGAVRKIDTNGTITTVAGNGTTGFSGDGGPATSAELSCPSGVTFDAAGDFFIADYSNNRVRKVDITGVITTIAGTGTTGFAGDDGPAISAELNAPNDVMADAAGNLYVVDSGNNRIRKIDTTGTITTFAGGLNNAGSAGVNSPEAVTLDVAGNLYFSDSGNNAIREFVPAGAVSFPATTVGTAATPITLTLSNIGNVAVTVAAQGGFTLGGNAADFSLTGGTCVAGAVIAPSGSCSMIIGFTPTAIGVRTLTVSVADDAVFSPQSFQISGTGVALPPAVTLDTITPSVVVAGTGDTTITAAGANFTATSVVDFDTTPLVTTLVSSTQLTAVIPAALLTTAGAVNVAVVDPSSESTSAAQSFTILPVSSVTFSGPPTSDPGDQPGLTFQLQQAYPVDLVGTITLLFTPDPGNPNDPQVQFSGGGTTYTFTLPANTTTTPPIMVQVGTISGTVSLTLQLNTAAGVNVTPPTLAPISIVVPKVAPTISKVSFTTSGNTLTVLVTGYSSTREIQSAVFNFTPMSGTTLAEKSITVSSTSLFATWYSDGDSTQYGSEFTYSQTFTLSTAASAVSNVGVTLTNTIGTSTEVTPQ